MFSRSASRSSSRQSDRPGPDDDWIPSPEWKADTRRNIEELLSPELVEAERQYLNTSAGLFEHSPRRQELLEIYTQAKRALRQRAQDQYSTILRQERAKRREPGVSTLNVYPMLARERSGRGRSRPHSPMPPSLNIPCDVATGDISVHDAFVDEGTFTVQPPSPPTFSSNMADVGYFDAFPTGHRPQRSVSRGSSVHRGTMGERAWTDSGTSEASSNSSYESGPRIWLPADDRGRAGPREVDSRKQSDPVKPPRSASHQPVVSGTPFLRPVDEARKDWDRLAVPGKDIRRAKSLDPPAPLHKARPRVPSTPPTSHVILPSRPLTESSPSHMPAIPSHRQDQGKPLRSVLKTAGRQEPRSNFRVTIKVITGDIFSQHEGFDLAPATYNALFQSKPPTFRVKSHTLWADFKMRVAEHFGYPAESFRLWITTRRPNGTVRPGALVTDADCVSNPVDGELIAEALKLSVYMEKPIVDIPQATSRTVMILLKCFDVSKQWVRGCGKIYAPPDATEPELRSLVLRSLNWSFHTKITLYKELAPGLVEMCKMALTKGCREHANGDIICFQRDLALDEFRDLEAKGLYPDAKSYYDFLHGRGQELLKADHGDMRLLGPEVSSYFPSNFSFLSTEPDTDHDSPTSPDDMAWIGRCRVEIEYVLRCLVHHDDEPSVLVWFAAYLRGSIHSAICKPFLKAIQSLEGKYASRMLLLLQSSLDRPDCYMSTAAADVDKFTLMLIRLLVRLTNKSRQHPLDLFIKGVVDFKDKPVAAGGFASVYIGSLDGKQVALKCLHITSTDPQGPSIRNKFYRETLLWRQLDHPYVLPFLGIYSAPGTRLDFPCMVSPWMSRGTIVQFAEKMDIRNAGRERLLAKAAEGLAYLHSIPIVHGDIKGVNIFVNDNGEPQLADFGLAVIGEASLGLTATTHGADGTVRWMAPELIDDGESESDVSQPRTVETDSYAFGCLCLEVFTLKAPFAHISRPAGVIIALSKGEKPRRPSDLECRGQAMSDRLWSMLLEECWSRSPEKRPTLAAVAARLSAM